MKLITHIEPTQLRLGYLCCLSLVAGRQLDTRQGASDSRFARFMEQVDRDALERLRTPLDEKTAELQELFRVKSTNRPEYQLQALWLAQRDLPSHLGLLTAKSAERILDMGRSFEILTTGYALSEKGVFVQQFLEKTMPGIRDGESQGNPFAIHKRQALQWFFLYALLTADILTPFVLREFASSPSGDPPNSPRLLPKAAESLAKSVEKFTDISNVAALRACSTYATRLETKAVARNQARPRYHHLLELGLLSRDEPDADRRTSPYFATEAGLRAAQTLMPLLSTPDQQQELLDKGFFGWAAQIYKPSAAASDSDVRRLYYFARGFPYLEREIGFTPGRTVALAGCLLALEEGWIVEVADMFKTLRDMAAGPWRPYLEYSGGSRLDQEFLIKVKPGLIPALKKELGV
jgi:hypothetical protein